MRAMSAGAWGITIGIIAILLIYPGGLLVNMTTPAVQRWIATRTRTSLANRITRLEAELKALEEFPPIDEVEDETLWDIRKVHMLVIAATSLIVLVIVDVTTILIPPNSHSERAEQLNIGVGVFVVGNAILIWRLRNKHDFRYKRSLKTRAGYRKAIDDLKTIRDSWPER
jgi:hypothetical protein